MNRNERGFTLAELIIVTVLGALLIAASLQVLVTNQRTYTAQTAKIQGQQTTRAAMDVLYNELREISAQGGDLISMGATSLTVRSMRKFGVVCAMSLTSPPVLRTLKVGAWFDREDSVFVFADNEPTKSSDDTWIPARVTGADTTTACGTEKAVNLSFASQGALFTADSVRVGAPVRGFVRYRYGLMSLDGETYLGRTGTDGTVAMVGPLKATSGLAFSYLDDSGAVTTNPTDVRQIVVTVRTASNVMNSIGGFVSDSITAVIYTRN